MYEKLLPSKLKYLKRLEKILIFTNILFKKVAIAHGKVEFPKVKANICNIPVDIENLCNIILRPIHSNILIVVKLNWKY